TPGLSGVSYSPVSYDASSLLGTLSYTGTYDSAADAGSYTIVPMGLYSNQLGYDILYVSGPLTVTPASLTIMAQDQSKRYGTTLTLGTAAFDVEGLLSTDGVSRVTLVSEGSLPGAAAGLYSIRPSAAVGQGLGNYLISYIDGALTVTPSSTGAQSVVSSFVSYGIDSVYGAMRFGCATCSNEGIFLTGGWNSPLDISGSLIPLSLPLAEVCIGS
ncbi:MAG: MBG domain-containing protein, partial [Alphaproteobacteria bacterium]|nr:MBG domain-containing protein [Alphaproteobacteria bacterium]